MKFLLRQSGILEHAVSLREKGVDCNEVLTASKYITSDVSLCEKRVDQRNSTIRKEITL